ncbi:hypothetical protein DQ237_07465 [Blastococcus sp. TF02-8]|uniref:hypothetical protein n=1 Tax=Blastococcus sp. TF02-8 TaxID=2250574 RepID=UPI000DFA9131|nr:hypothetical protein [Blastococcus sp. TF02-8]RBY96480.1 hypothetical protein DQ237_07465 [Blastococcus sp. TF02-8]
MRGEEPLRDLGDLPGRVQLLAITVFVSVWAAIAFVPRLWGTFFFSEHFSWVGAALGLPWWFAVERYGPRAARHPMATAGEPDDARLLRTVRRRALRYRWRRATAWLVLPTVILLGGGGHFSYRSDQELIDQQPHRAATVSAVERSPFDRGSDGPRVTVTLDGREAVLFLPFPEEDDVVPGDRLVVVADPEDPTYVLAVSSHDEDPGWTHTWWGDLLLWGAVGGVLGGIWLWWALSVPRAAARVAARHARHVCEVQLVDVGGPRLALHDVDGSAWTWTADDDAWAGPTRGRVRVVGELRDGAWPVVAAGRTLHWPGAPVRRTPWIS